MKMHWRIALALPVMVIMGCADPADKVPDAAVGEVVKPQVAKSGETTPFTIGSASKIGFVGSKVTGSHNGGFKEFKGTIHVAGGKLAPTGSRIEIDMASTWSDNDRLTRHLKSADFFDVEKHKTAVFEATAIEVNGGKATVTGNLTLHGVTKSIRFPAEVMVSEGQATLKADFSINRFDFGIKYPGKSDDLIREEVVIKLDIVAAPAA